MMKKRKQTAVKGRSSALVITIAVHAALFLVAGYFVAVEVIERQETKFEGKQIVRPKMKLKKLQMPVKIDKVKRQAPKLRQRMTAKNVRTKSVQFKMPELGGFGDGGVDANVSGMGLGGGGLGFASTKLNIFGVKSSGEKILFVLDASARMLENSIGGIPAYEIIKNELLTMIESLPPTALFNVVVHDTWKDGISFSKEMSPASAANVKKAKEWLGPLNAQLDKYGTKTLGFKGTGVKFEPAIPIGKSQGGWMSGVSYGLQKGADTIYWLGREARTSGTNIEDYNAYKSGKDVEAGKKGGRKSGPERMIEKIGQEKWDKLLAEAKKIYDEENARLKAAGKPMWVIPYGSIGLINEILPGKLPKLSSGKSSASYEYRGRDVIEYIETMQKKYAAADTRSAEIGLKKKKITFNAIHFVPLMDQSNNNDKDDREFLPEVVAKKQGTYVQIKGLKSVQSKARAKKANSD